MSHIRSWKERDVSSVMVIDVFQSIAQNGKHLTIGEVEEFPDIEEESCEEEVENNVPNLVTPNVSENCSSFEVKSKCQ